MNLQNNLFQPLACHREGIATEIEHLKIDTSPSKCILVKSCISNAKNITVKLDDLRTAQDHDISEFCKGILNILGGVLAIVVLSPLRAVTLCKAQFSDMVNLVDRGASRCGNAFKKVEILEEEITAEVNKLNTALEFLPELRNMMYGTQQAVQVIKDHITAITDLANVNRFRVEEQMCGGPGFEEDVYFKYEDDRPFWMGRSALFDSIGGKSLFSSLRKLNADEFYFVKLVNSLSTIAFTHLADLNEEIQASLKSKEFDDLEKEAIENLFDTALQNESAKLANMADDEFESSDELIETSGDDTEFASSFEVNVEINDNK